jgi:hypothetical protein
MDFLTFSGPPVAPHWYVHAAMFRRFADYQQVMTSWLPVVGAAAVVARLHRTPDLAAACALPALALLSPHAGGGWVYVAAFAGSVAVAWAALARRGAGEAACSCW